MNKKRKCVSTFIEVLLMLSIMLAAFSVFLKVSVLNKNTYTNIFEKSNAYEHIKESIYSKIDAVLSAKNINYDIKESIITEQDIRNEADNAISGFIEYLKTGENNIKPVDAEIYKQRVNDILHSIIGNAIKPANGEISLNDQVQIKETACSNNDTALFNNLIVIKETAQSGQDTLKVQKLMTRDEAEAKVRDLLKQKGMTMDQAIKKAQEKGITEEQAKRMLAGYGITIDEEPKSNNSTTNNAGNVQSKSGNNSNSSDVQDSNNSVNDSPKEPSDNNTEGNTSQMQTDKGAKSGLSLIENKLFNEAGANIEKEVEKVNFNKIAESSKIQKLAQITSKIYKMFWIIMLLPVILMILLIRINRKDINYGLKQIRNAFLCSGLVFCGIFFSIYGLKPYEKIDINPIYFKDTIFYAAKYFLTILCTYGVIVLVIGLFMFIMTSTKLVNAIKTKLFTK